MIRPAICHRVAHLNHGWLLQEVELKIQELRKKENEVKALEAKAREDGTGQIIVTSRTDRFPPNGGLAREIPLFQENPGW